MPRDLLATRQPRDLLANLDTRRGAPANVRAVVGSVVNPDDRLATMRNFYPDATPTDDDNFTFKDPETGRDTLYNPPGFDAGDVASVSREILQMLGAGVGGALAAPPAIASSPPTAGSSLLAIPAGAALGSQAAGEIYDRALDFMTPRVDTRGLPQQMSDVAGGTLVETLGGKYLPMLGQSIKKGFAGVKNRLAGIDADAVLRAFRDIGVEPTAGTVTGNRAVQGVENALRQSPGAQGVLQKTDDEVLERVTRYAGEVANKFGAPQSTQGQGQVLKEASQGAVNRFIDRADELYGEASKLIPDTVRAAPTHILDYGYSLSNQAVAKDLPKTAKRVQNKAVMDVMADFTSDVVGPDGAVKEVSYESLKALRTRIGKMMKDPRAYPDFDAAQLKGLYGALSKDMDAIAERAGPDAMKAHQTASRYFRFNMNENIAPLEKVLEKGSDEEAAKYVLSGMKDGDTRLKTMRRNMKPEEWGVVAGSVLNKLGRAKDGAQDASGEVFSPATFLTNWNGLSPEAKTTLFYGKRYAGLREPLDRLVRITAAMKDSQAGRNTSNTAGATAVLGAVGLLGGAAVGGDAESALKGAGGLVLAPYAAARLMTSHKFVSWLADTAKPTLTQNGFAAQLGRLVAIAKAEPDIREEIEQYMDAMRQQ